MPSSAKDKLIGLMVKSYFIKKTLILTLHSKKV